MPQDAAPTETGNQMQAVQQFIVQIAIPQEGPKGGKRAPIVKQFCVAASSNEEARAVFAAECPEQNKFVTFCGETRGRVWAAA